MCAPGESSLAQASTCEILPPPIPTIMHGVTKIIFNHFKSNTNVKTILASVAPANWQNGDTLTIYANGTRDLNVVVFTYYGYVWSPVNVNVIHSRDNLYIFNTPRAPGDTTSVMSIRWQQSTGVDLFGNTSYVKRINMQPHFLRKAFRALHYTHMSAQNNNNFQYTPFGVRVVNNVPTHTTDITYTCC